MELLYNAIFLEDSSSEIEQHVPYFPVYMRHTFFPNKVLEYQPGHYMFKVRVKGKLCVTL